MSKLSALSGLRSGSRIDALILNNQKFGGNGGKESRQLEFQGEEYIEKLVIRHGSRIDSIELTTNLGRVLMGGGSGGSATVLSNIRVLGLGGNAASELDKLRVRYIKDYVPSKLVEQGALAVISVIPQGQTLETFVSSRTAQLSATRQFFEIVSTVETESAAGELLAKASTKFSLTATTSTEFFEQVETETIESETRTYSPPQEHIGLEVVQVDMFRSSDGTAWFFPVSEPSVASVPVDGADDLPDNLFDMTGTLGLHMPGVADARQERDGYHYYSMETVSV